jgi:hypothetical protein
MPWSSAGHHLKDVTMPFPEGMGTMSLKPLRPKFL